MMTTGNTPGAGLPPEGAGAEGDTFDYLHEPGSDASPDPSAPEDPRRREARLRRRRRLLKIGGVPAVLATTISLWLGSIFLISLAGSRRPLRHCAVPLPYSGQDQPLVGAVARLLQSGDRAARRG